MNLNEIMKANGIEDDVISKITNEMKSNGIYLSKENNIDFRYNKLKTENENVTQTINELQAKLVEVDNLQKQLESLQNENVKIKLDSALDRALVEAKVQDVDYLKYKIKEKNPNGLKLDENGKLESLNTILDDLKVQFPNQFIKTEKVIEEQKLPKDDNDKGSSITKEQFDKMNYHDKVKLYQENKEQYEELSK